MTTWTVLGGSAAGGNTDAGCAGFLFRCGDTSVVIDLGPGTFHELRKYCDYRDLAGIVISHMHLDHLLDLAAMRYHLAYSPNQPERKVPLWLPPDGAARLDQIGSAFAGEPATEFFEPYFSIQEYDPTRVLSIGEVSAAFTPARHFLTCYAMRLSSPEHGGDVGYTADTGPVAAMAAFFEGVSLLVSESTWVDHATPPQERLHMTAAEAAQLANECSASELLLTHWWEEVGAEAYLEAATSVFTGGVHIAKPGLCLDVATSDGN